MVLLCDQTRAGIEWPGESRHVAVGNVIEPVLGAVRRHCEEPLQGHIIARLRQTTHSPIAPRDDGIRQTIDGGCCGVRCRTRQEVLVTLPRDAQLVALPPRLRLPICPLGITCRRGNARWRTEARTDGVGVARGDPPTSDIVLVCRHSKDLRQRDIPVAEGAVLEVRSVFDAVHGKLATEGDGRPGAGYGHIRLTERQRPVVETDLFTKGRVTEGLDVLVDLYELFILLLGCCRGLGECQARATGR